MSQTETLLLIVVGFSIAALIFLLLARALWRAGVRLGARRMRRQVPTTVAELRSERDSLRGEYARLSQKLSSRLDQARLQMAEQMAEVARHRNRLARMVIDLNDRDAEIEGQILRLAALEEDLRDRTARHASTETELQKVSAELARAEAEAEQLRSRLAQLEALQIQPMPDSGTHVVPLPDSAAQNADRLKLRIEKLAVLSQAIAAERGLLADPDAESPLDPVLQEKLETVARETADLQQELSRLDAAWAGKLGDPETGDNSAASGKPRAVANVISLAQRIRSLQKDLAR